VQGGEYKREGGRNQEEGARDEDGGFVEVGIESRREGVREVAEKPGEEDVKKVYELDHVR
jgi:hypothetical protein